MSLYGGGGILQIGFIKNENMKKIVVRRNLLIDIDIVKIKK